VKNCPTAGVQKIWMGLWSNYLKMHSLKYWEVSVTISQVQFSVEKVSIFYWGLFNKTIFSVIYGSNITANVWSYCNKLGNKNTSKIWAQLWILKLRRNNLL